MFNRTKSSFEHNLRPKVVHLGLRKWPRCRLWGQQMCAASVWPRICTLIQRRHERRRGHSPSPCCKYTVRRVALDRCPLKGGRVTATPPHAARYHTPQRLHVAPPEAFPYAAGALRVRCRSCRSCVHTQPTRSRRAHAPGCPSPHRCGNPPEWAHAGGCAARFRRKRMTPGLPQSDIRQLITTMKIGGGNSSASLASFAEGGSDGSAADLHCIVWRQIRAKSIENEQDNQEGT